MTDATEDPWEASLIADMRAHGGAVTSGPLAGHPLLIMSSTGARSGQTRRAILTYSRDGDTYVVAGSAGGAPTDPMWVRNVRANPSVAVEIGEESFRATATVVDEPERTRLWDEHARRLPWFADYPAQSGRAIPIVRLARDPS